MSPFDLQNSSRRAQCSACRLDLVVVSHNVAHNEIVHALKVPIVAVNGDRFPTNFAANRRHAPQFDAVIMKGVGHYPMLEDPARFGTLLDEALRKVESPAARR